MGTSSVSTISSAAIQDVIKSMKLKRHRDSTKKNYYAIWKIFSKFFLRLDNKPIEWEDRIILFVGYLIIKKKKSSTIRSYVSTIKSVLIDEGKQVSEDKVLLAALTKVCKLNFDVAHNKLPVKKGMIHMLLSTVEKLYHDQLYLKILYKAMIVTAYYRLFRIGEITAGPHVIKTKDVLIGTNKNK